MPRVTQKDVAACCESISRIHGVDVSVRAVAGRYTIELGTGRALYHGTARQCVHYLSGFEQGILAHKESSVQNLRKRYAKLNRGILA